MSLPRNRPRGGHKLSGVLASLTYLAFTSITWRRCRRRTVTRDVDRKRGRRPISQHEDRHMGNPNMIGVR